MKTILKYFCVPAAMLLSVAGAGAFEAQGEAARVARGMLRCLDLPENAPETYALKVAVVMKNGEAEMVSVNFSAMPSAWEMAAAEVVADAITECAPYGSISGAMVLEVNPALVAAGRI